MRLILGIGNPEQEYEGTRHNLGFAVIDRLGEARGIACRKRRFRSLTGSGRIGREAVLFMKPQTYVNESGAALREAVEYFACPLEEVLVVCDDFALPLGQLRVRAQGSSGGHNGLRSIAAALGTDVYSRLRLGIGREKEERYGRDFVLSRFAADEMPAVRDMVIRAAEAVVIWVEQGIGACMERTNRREEAGPSDPKEEKRVEDV